MAELLQALSCSVGSWTFWREGDPGLAGWITVGVYVVAAVLGGAVAWRGGSAGGSRAFWALVAVLLAVLAINKQLDLQILFSRTMRCMAADEGWSDPERRSIQQRILIGIGLGLAALVGVVAIRMRRRVAQVRLPLFGLALVGLFVAVRAAAFNHLDGPLHRMLTTDRVKDSLELAGPLVILAAAILRLARRR